MKPLLYLGLGFGLGLIVLAIVIVIHAELRARRASRERASFLEHMRHMDGKQ